MRVAGGRTFLASPFLVLAVLISVTVPSYAQPAGTTYTAETSLVFGTSGDVLPFWLTSNRFGVDDPTSTNLNARLAISTQGALSGRLRYLLGADVVTRASDNAAVFFQQAYGQLRSGSFLLHAGLREESVGLVEHSLSLGSMTLGRNAAPLPMISISVPEFVNIPGTGGYIGFRGLLGHGWLTGKRVVRHAFLHEKYLFLRFGQVDGGLHAYLGLTHFSQWGGTHANPEFGHLPSGLGDFFRIMFARPAGRNTDILPEVENVLGNALGAYDMRLDFVRPLVTISVYRQFYLEDTVSLRLRNKWDGLWGVLLRFSDSASGIQSVLWEHVNTKQQGSMPSERLGTDNYYNHVLYGSGWTNRGRSMGLPLMITAPGFEGVVNNILVAHHLGVSGSLGERLAYMIFATYSRNYGVHTLIDSGSLRRYETELPLKRKDQYSAALNVKADVSTRLGVAGIVRLAYDWGALLPDHNFGVSIGILKEGSF